MIDPQEPYDFTPNRANPLGLCKSFKDGPHVIRVRCEYLPVVGCRPGELFFGYQYDDFADNDAAYEHHLLLSVEELGDLIKNLKKIHKSWKAYEAANGED